MKQWFVYHVIWHWISFIRFVHFRCTQRVRKCVFFFGVYFVIFHSERCARSARANISVSFTLTRSLACSLVRSTTRSGRSYAAAVFVIETGNFMVIITVVACHYYSVCSQKVKFNSLFVSHFFACLFLGSLSLSLSLSLTATASECVCFLLCFYFILNQSDFYLDGCFLASVKPFPYYTRSLLLDFVLLLWFFSSSKEKYKYNKFNL